MNSLNIIMKLLESRYRFFSSFDKKFNEPWHSMLEYNVAHSLLNEKLHLHRVICVLHIWSFHVAPKMYLFTLRLLPKRKYIS